MSTLGDRMKTYEAFETERRTLPGLPIVVRVDGRGFSKFTAGMTRPFDARLAELMTDVTRYLVEQTHAVIGYTQSDEITLVLEAPGGDPSRAADVFFGGRIQKLVSMAAALATARFMAEAPLLWPERCAQALPAFDARVFAVPSRLEAVHALLWREHDATKNAISMAARAHFSHAAVEGKSGAEKQEMLFRDKGINFNDYPARFKRGVFVRRESVWVPLAPEVLAQIPEGRRPTGPVERKTVVALDWPRLGQIRNRVEAIFERAPLVCTTEAPAVAESV